MVGEALVYVVDDDDAIRAGLRLLLESNGWHAETYASAEAFLLAYSPRHQACLLLDLEMPGMNGPELQTELLARGVSLPVIVMTARDERRVVHRAQAAGAMAVLRKPFREAALLPLIEKAIAGESAHRTCPKDITMTDLIRQLRIDHSNVSKILDILGGQLQSIAREQTTDYELMQDAMHYMTQYPDIAHHPVEDVIFGFVVVRAPEATGITAELKREHAALAEKGSMFLDGLRHIVDGAMVERDLVTSRGHDYIQFLHHHMKKEEETIFPLAETLLQDEDWEAASDLMTEMRDPLFGPVVQDDYRRIYQLVTQAQA